MPEEIEDTEVAEETQPQGKAAKGPDVRTAEFAQITPASKSNEHNPLDLILDVTLDATVELGRSSLVIRDILALGPGSVVELDKLAGEPADFLINGKPLARGEVVVIDDHFGLRVTEIMSPSERINSLR